MVYREGYAADRVHNTASNVRPFMYPGHIISVDNHLTLTNLLPIDLLFTLQGVAVKGRLGPSKTQPIHDVDCRDTFEMAFECEGFSKCDLIRIEQNYHNEPVLIPVCVSDSMHRQLILNLMVNQSMGSMKVKQNCYPYLLILILDESTSIF